MPSAEFSGFKGIDVRNDPAAMDQRALIAGTNVDLTVGGEIKRRAGMRKVCDLSSESVGLFSANGFLRTVVPGGQSIQDTRPPEVFYDPIGDGAAYALGSLSKLHAVEVIGSATVQNATPYVVIEKSDGRIEHHWLTANPPTAATAVDTKVSLPFDPGKTLIKSNAKLFANDPSNGVLWYSSTLNGPTDWREPRDAGFVAVRQFVPGSRDITALGYYRGGLVSVLFADAIELWQMDPDPTRFRLVTVFNGPGTEAPGTVANVLGDMFYYSKGGFRSLSINTVSGESNETDIGAPVQPLTDDIDLSTVKPVSLWSQARSQYICAFGTDVWVYTYSPVSKVRGWTRWTLPVSADYLVEHDGELYIRADDTVYVLDAEQEDDRDSDAVEYDVQPAFWHANRQGVKKFWKFLDVVMTGDTEISFQIDPDSPQTAINANPLRLDDTTYIGGLVGVNAVSDVLSLRFQGDDPTWRLSSVTLHFDPLRMT